MREYVFVFIDLVPVDKVLKLIKRYYYLSIHLQKIILMLLT